MGINISGSGNSEHTKRDFSMLQKSPETLLTYTFLNNPHLLLSEKPYLMQYHAPLLIVWCLLNTSSSIPSMA